MTECPLLATSPSMSALSAASFGLFLRALSSEANAPQGCFLSPLSIVYAVLLAVNGAGPNSITQTELLRVITGTAGQQQGISEADLNSDLGRAMTFLNGQCAADGAKEPGSDMVIANSIWTRNITLKPAYVDSMKSIFQATAREATKGAESINEWVTEATSGMITDLVKNDNFIVVLANAIYFKGLWEHAFTRESTLAGEFVTSCGDAKQVPMMSQVFEGRKTLRGVRKEGLYVGVSLPYKGGAFSAVALLPEHGVEPRAALKDWAAQRQELAVFGRTRLVMPKFKVTSTLSLKAVLKDLGVQAAFLPEAADFSRMTDDGLYISDVLHKAVVEVDEEGTVAAAATAVMMLTSIPVPPEVITFNRPFVFMIYHDATGLPAFVGVVNDPTA